MLAVWRIKRPVSFDRWVFFPALSKRGRWRYHRHWAAVMTIGRLAAVHSGRVLVPVLGEVTATPCTDLVSVRLVSGQSAADFAHRAENIASGFRSCCAGSAPDRRGDAGPFAHE